MRNNASIFLVLKKSNYYLYNLLSSIIHSHEKSSPDTNSGAFFIV